MRINNSSNILKKQNKIKLKKRSHPRMNLEITHFRGKEARKFHALAFPAWSD